MARDSFGKLAASPLVADGVSVAVGSTGSLSS
jgi:hypothetical protein